MSGLATVAERCAAVSGVAGSGLARLERAIGLPGASSLVGLVLLGLSVLYYKPNYALFTHGVEFAQLSLHPFRPSSPVSMQKRLLTPLVARALGLQGTRFWVVPYAFGWLFLSTIYAYLRRQQIAADVSMLMAAAMAFSSPLIHLYRWGGFTDTTTHFLMVLALLWIRSPVRWALSLAAGVLNHEITFVFVPWYLYLMVTNGTSRARILGAAAVFACLVLLVAGLWAWLPNTGYSVDFYLQRNRLSLGRWMIRHEGWAGWWSGFGVFWLIPIAAVISSSVKRDWTVAAAILLNVALAAMTMLIAADLTRIFSFAVGSVVLAICGLHRYWSRRWVVSFLWLLTAVNLCLDHPIITGFY